MTNWFAAVEAAVPATEESPQTKLPLWAALAKRPAAKLKRPPARLPSPPGIAAPCPIALLSRPPPTAL